MRLKKQPHCIYFSISITRLLASPFALSKSRRKVAL